MKTRSLLAVVTVVLLSSSAAWTYYKKATAGEDMTGAAKTFLATLSDEERATTLLEYGSPKRVDWHFIPKEHRKGLQIREMDKKQRKAAHALLQSALSEMGYDKTVRIMELESLLHLLEGGKGRFARDPQRYYFTVFGEPAAKGKWGLSVEGHHLSLNFVIEDGNLASTTPQFFGANPAVVMKDYEGADIKEGTRVLAKEETLAFDLVKSFSAEQAKQGIIAEKAPAEIRAAGEAQPPIEKPAGIKAADLDEKQRKTLRALIQEYARAMPYEVASRRLAAIDEAGFENVHFAWAGPTKPGIGHYYRVQGETFLIDFVNTQPDAAGNPANHIHCVWRDTQGDFAIAIKKK